MTDGAGRGNSPCQPLIKGKNALHNRTQLSFLSYTGPVTRSKMLQHFLPGPSITALFTPTMGQDWLARLSGGRLSEREGAPRPAGDMVISIGTALSDLSTLQHGLVEFDEAWIAEHVGEVWRGSGDVDIVHGEVWLE
nr:hypothetical protein L203_01405 [Cryptococcus depauperatus CBS 7841]